MIRRIIPTEKLEVELRKQGYAWIVGLDEVGRGAWAGPLVVGAVILPENHRILNLRDSKLLSRLERERLARRIKRIAVAWAIGVVEVTELNRIGLAKSLSLGAARALEQISDHLTNVSFDRSFLGCKSKGVLVLVDGKHPFQGLDFPQRAIVRGDQTIRSIAAASIIAKVHRDRLMRTLHRNDKSIRRFRFDLNKGYPSPWHRQQLFCHGPSSYHRLIFTPVKKALAQMSASS